MLLIEISKFLNLLEKLILNAILNQSYILKMKRNEQGFPYNALKYSLFNFSQKHMPTFFDLRHPT